MRPARPKKVGLGDESVLGSVAPGGARRLVLRLKYQGCREAAEVLAAAMAPLLPADASVLAPIPRIYSRRLKYRSDPGLLLAQALSRRSGLELCHVLGPRRTKPLGPHRPAVSPPMDSAARFGAGRRCDHHRNDPGSRRGDVGQVPGGGGGDRNLFPLRGWTGYSLGAHLRKGISIVEIRLSARNTELAPGFRQTVSDKMNRAARVFSDLKSVDVEVTRETNPRLAEARFRVQLTGQALGRMIRAEAAAPTPETALDSAADRFTRRVRRLKKKVIDRTRHTGSMPPTTLEPEADEIVRVKRFIIKPMSVAEAQLQMEMLGHDFFFFLNSTNNRHSVLYRRRDGRLGLIESQG